MLYLPEASPVFRILSIDPGSDTLGVAVLDADLSTYQASLVFVRTLNGTRDARQYPFVSETFGDRQARLHAHQQSIASLLQHYQPHCVISEAPYLGRFPQAFETLVECLYMLRAVVWQYDPGMCLETVDPPSVKIAVGAPGKSKKGEDKKEPVRQGVLNLHKLHNRSGVDLTTLDEHAIDAIAVGCYKLRCISHDIL